MAKSARPIAFVIVSLVFHLLLTVSVFDIYFTSPVVHPTRRFSLADSYEDGSTPPRPPADRLVLIVGDGLRADTLFKEEHAAAPHLRDVCINRGAWGLSHTRVPTESRPGHVALIAGMYEDVSAVTKGWKANPVAFDSFINVSSRAWTFGSPDILPMFGGEHVEARSYEKGDEDFTSDATRLDAWVKDEVDALFDRARHNATLAHSMRQPGTVFFLHLLGLDTTGHTYGPHSPEYVNNLAVVDGIVAHVEKLFADFYGDDDRTAWIFSADHGMSSKGNHGDGEPDNTRTPLVAWGAGVRGPRPADEKQMATRRQDAEDDSYYAGWGAALHSLHRSDVDQADVTALMATLLGVPFPSNSEGVLPLDYITLDAEQSSRAMFANAREILEIYRVKHEMREARTLRYVPFAGLPPTEGKLPGEVEVEGIRKLIAAQHYGEAIAACRRLIDLSLQGAQYLQTYDWLLLVTIVTLGYVASILYGFAFVLRNYVYNSEVIASKSGLVSLAPVSVAAALCAKFAAESAPVTYHLYAIFTAVYWSWVLQERHILSRALSNISLRTVALVAIYCAFALQLIALGYTVRIAWTLGFFFLGFVWPWLSLDDVARSKHEGTILLWGVCCIASGLFTLADVDKQESRMLLALSGAVVIVAGLVVAAKPALFLGGATHSAVRTQRVIYGQVALTFATTCVTLSSSYHLQNKLGLPLINQLLAWLFLGTSTTLPFLLGFHHAQPTSQRLAIIIFASAPPFILLSLRDEALFFLCFTATLLVWAKMEGVVNEERLIATTKQQDGKPPRLPRSLGLYDLLPSTTLLFLLHAAFFGTGNVASISSFYLKPVYRLVPVFSPFLMAALLIAKILVPFVVLGSVLQTLCKGQVSKRVTKPEEAYKVSGQSRKSVELAGPPLLGPDSVGGLHLAAASATPLLLTSSLCADVLALWFLFHVKNEGGSWLEIGQSITHFVMANLLQVFMFGISVIAGWALGNGDETR